ncbi:MAG: apolipoprotein N-acyltransferase [Sedimentisphaerales bacterium]|nr:apolipoprotein N-acyltransferase [Sedimentisphaerales bacterium]
MAEKSKQQLRRQDERSDDDSDLSKPAGMSFANRWVIFLMLISIGGLSAIQEPMGWSWLGWVVLVPWVLGAVTVRRLRWGVLIIYGAGLLYFLSNLYWLVGVTVPGYLALGFYLAWYFPLCAVVLRWVYRRTRWPFALVLPVVWVGQEYLRATLMTGFPWLFLGHSQHENYKLIQVCDLVGVYGVTFLLAAMNGVVCDLLLRPIRRMSRDRSRWGVGVIGLVAMVLLLLVVSFYGRWRLKQGERTMTPGPIVTVVQDVVPQYVRGAKIDMEEIFARHLELTEAALAAEARPDLVVWPETMTAPLNREYLRLPVVNESVETARYQDTMLRLLTVRSAVDILVGTPTVMYEQRGDAYYQVSRRNSAVLYERGGDAWQSYSKMHLVPFGEVVPFRQSWPWLYGVLNNLTPYDYEYSLDTGTEATVFNFADSQQHNWRFAVAICYEDVMPQVVRQLAGVEDGAKRVDFLLNISNDGWFVREAGKGPVATTELLQHMVICQFRAIENRVGIARSVNTGISCFIRPDGMVQQAGMAGDLPGDPRQRQVVAGFLTDRIMCDSRVTVYSRIGDSFAMLCTGLLGVIALTGMVDGWRQRKQRQKSSAQD